MNAVIGAKVEILGYEVADEQLTFPLLPDNEWILWAFNWDLEEDQTIHQSPKAKEEQKQLDEIKPKFMKVMGEMMERWPNNYQNYEDLLTIMMNVKGMTHDQAEEEVMKRLVKDMPDLLQTSENMNSLMSGVNLNVLKYCNEVYPKYEAMMAEQSWKEVLETLKQSPAYEKYNKYYSENFYVNLNLDMIHKHFVNENQREPGNVKTDIETLVSYMKDFSMVYYLYNPKIQAKYNQEFLNMLIDYGRTVRGFDSKDTDLAAYETVLSLYSIYRNLDCSKWDLNYNGGYLKRQYKNVLDFIYRNK